MSFEELEHELLESLAKVHAAAEAGAVDRGRAAAKECATALSSLKLEARCASGAEKDVLTTRIKAHEAAVADANRALDAAASRSLLSGGSASSASSGGAGATGASADAHARAAASTAKLSEGTTKLLEAQRKLEETVAVGEGTVVALHEQRAKLGAIKEKVDGVSAAADEANSITKRMSSFWGGLFGK